MIVYLNYCSQDRDLTLNLLRWIGELGGCRKHDLVLQGSQQVLRSGDNTAVFEEAFKHFNTVEEFTPFTEDERGWPHSPNHGWIQAVTHMREKFANMEKGKVAPGWFWLEPDCVPLVSDWMDKIEAEYMVAKKPFMGAEVTVPEHRLSGVAVYPPMVVTYLRNRRMGDMHIRQDAFDSYFAPEIIPNSKFTDLIQNVHLVSRNPDLLPTFPDRESLSLIDSKAVLFHRCKDGTLIERLRELKAGCVSGLNVSAKAQERGAGIALSNPALPPEGSTPSPAMAALIAENERLKAALATTSAVSHVVQGEPAQGLDMPHETKGGGTRRHKKRKVKRTPEEQAKINERMAKARAGRGKLVPV